MLVCMSLTMYNMIYRWVWTVFVNHFPPEQPAEKEKMRLEIYIDLLTKSESRCWGEGSLLASLLPIVAKCSLRILGICEVALRFHYCYLSP